MKITINNLSKLGTTRCLELAAATHASTVPVFARSNPDLNLDIEIRWQTNELGDNREGTFTDRTQ